MSLLDYANLFNATGLALILAISWLVLARYPSVMFREWTRAYGALFAGVTLDLVADMAHLGRPLLCVRILAAVTAAWYFGEPRAWCEADASHPDAGTARRRRAFCCSPAFSSRSTRPSSG